VKVDLKRELGCYSARVGEFSVVRMPRLQYLMVEGHGDPNTSVEYADAIAAIYPVAYRLKFTSKRERERDYVVMPLEAQWSAGDMAAFTSARDKSAWDWTLLNLVPDWLTRQDVDAALAVVGESANRPAAFDRIRFGVIDEGIAVQTLHIGPYDDEGPVLARMHDDFIPSQGLRPTGRHHEVYFSDARRAEPAKLRTLLRQPVEAG